MSFSNLYCFNAWLLLSPSSLCCDWTLGSIPLVTSFSDVKNIWSLILYCSLAALIFHTLCSKRDRFQLGMGLSLLLLPYFPASGLLFRVGFVIAERYTHIMYSTCLVPRPLPTVYVGLAPEDKAVYTYVPLHYISISKFRVLYMPSLGYCVIVTIGIRRMHSFFSFHVSLRTRTPVN